jgi:hypothetical protein
MKSQSTALLILSICSPNSKEPWEFSSEKQGCHRWAAEVGDKRRKRQLVRIAIPYVAFEVQAAIDLRARAGRMTKKFNEFENNRQKVEPSNSGKS